MSNLPPDQLSLTALGPKPDHAEMTIEEFEALVNDMRNEPWPVYRCQICGLEVEPIDFADQTSSEWFRMESHALETGHEIGIYWDRDEDLVVRLRP